MNEWIKYSVTRDRPAIRLFCFPYAGGNAAIYCRWSNCLPDEVEVCPIQYPGHGNRLAEDLIDSIDEMVNAIIEELGDDLTQMPFAFFGYSMGALVAFELTRALRRRNLNLPECLFVAARCAPSIHVNKVDLHTMSDQNFLDEIKQFDGTPEGFFEEPALVQLALPVLRADFKLCETFEYRDEDPLDVPIVAISGNLDTAAPPLSMDLWQRQTTKEFERVQCSGKHFFLQSNEAKIRECIRRKLASEGISSR